MKKQRYRFFGMNNVDSAGGRPDRSGTFREVRQLTNVDPDAQGRIALRPGRTLSVPCVQAHSGWGNGREAYFVEGGALKRFWPGGDTSIVRLGISDAPMAFCQVNDVVAYGNGKESGVIENGVNQSPFVPTAPHKFPMVPGYLLAFFGGRLYAAYGNALYCSDALDVPGGIESMDERFNVVAVFESPLSLLLPVAGGLFVSDHAETFFLSGSDPQVEGFTQRDVLDCPAVRGTGLIADADLFGIEGLSGKVALWTSAEGVVLGTASGEVIPLSRGTVAIDPGRSGADIIRRRNGRTHYLTVMRDPQPGNAYDSGVTQNSHSIQPA